MIHIPVLSIITQHTFKKSIVSHSFTLEQKEDKDEGEFKTVHVVYAPFFFPDINNLKLYWSKRAKGRREETEVDKNTSSH